MVTRSRLLSYLMPVAGSFNFTKISNEQMDQSAPFLAGSLPANGLCCAPVDTFVACASGNVHASKHATRIRSRLSGSEGTLEAKIVPAESAG